MDFVPHLLGRRGQVVAIGCKVVEEVQWLLRSDTPFNNLGLALGRVSTLSIFDISAANERAI